MTWQRRSTRSGWSCWRGKRNGPFNVQV